MKAPAAMLTTLNRLSNKGRTDGILSESFPTVRLRTKQYGERPPTASSTITSSGKGGDDPWHGDEIIMSRSERLTSILASRHPLAVDVD
jgi:hypothetical protein